LEVLDAELDHGLLAIHLRRRGPEQKVRLVPIRSGSVHPARSIVLQES
jgi:hypothetical protein